MTMHHSASDIIQVTSQIYTGQQGDKGSRGRAHGWEIPAVEIQLHCFETPAGSFSTQLPKIFKAEAVHTETKEPVGARNGTLSFLETSVQVAPEMLGAFRHGPGGEIRWGLGGPSLHPAPSGAT